MPGEKQNNLYEQLSAPEGLPTVLGFNEEALWQRLEPRLSRQRKKQKAWWIAAAAAVVMGLLLFNQPKVSTPYTLPVIHETAIQRPAPLKQAMPLQQATAPVTQTTVAKAKTVKPSSVATLSTPLPVRHQAIAPLSIAYEPVAVPVPVTVSLLPFSTATAPSQKRFRVAHINELNALPTDVQASSNEAPRKPLLATVSEVSTTNEKATVQLRRQSRALSLNASQ